MAEDFHKFANNQQPAENSFYNSDNRSGSLINQTIIINQPEFNIFYKNNGENATQTKIQKQESGEGQQAGVTGDVQSDNRGEKQRFKSPINRTVMFAEASKRQKGRIREQSPLVGDAQAQAPAKNNNNNNNNNSSNNNIQQQNNNDSNGRRVGTKQSSAALFASPQPNENTISAYAQKSKINFYSQGGTNSNTAQGGNSSMKLNKSRNAEGTGNQTSSSPPRNENIQSNIKEQLRIILQGAAGAATIATNNADGGCLDAAVSINNHSINRRQISYTRTQQQQRPRANVSHHNQKSSALNISSFYQYPGSSVPQNTLYFAQGSQMQQLNQQHQPPNREANEQHEFNLRMLRTKRSVQHTQQAQQQANQTALPINERRTLEAPARRTSIAALAPQLHGGSVAARNHATNNINSNNMSTIDSYGTSSRLPYHVQRFDTAQSREGKEFSDSFIQRKSRSTTRQQSVLRERERIQQQGNSFRAARAQNFEGETIEDKEVQQQNNSELFFYNVQLQSQLGGGGGGGAQPGGSNEHNSRQATLDFSNSRLLSQNQSFYAHGSSNNHAQNKRPISIKRPRQQSSHGCTIIAAEEQFNAQQRVLTMHQHHTLQPTPAQRPSSNCDFVVERENTNSKQSGKKKGVQQNQQTVRLQQQRASDLDESSLKKQRRQNVQQQQLLGVQRNLNNIQLPTNDTKSSQFYNLDLYREQSPQPHEHSPRQKQQLQTRTLSMHQQDKNSQQFMMVPQKSSTQGVATTTKTTITSTTNSNHQPSVNYTNNSISVEESQVKRRKSIRNRIAHIHNTILSQSETQNASKKSSARNNNNNNTNHCIASEEVIVQDRQLIESTENMIKTLANEQDEEEYDIEIESNSNNNNNNNNDQKDNRNQRQPRRRLVPHLPQQERVRLERSLEHSFDNYFRDEKHVQRSNVDIEMFISTTKHPINRSKQSANLVAAGAVATATTEENEVFKSADKIDYGYNFNFENDGSSVYGQGGRAAEGSVPENGQQKQPKRAHPPTRVATPVSNLIEEPSDQDEGEAVSETPKVRKNAVAGNVNSLYQCYYNNNNGTLSGNTLVAKNGTNQRVNSRLNARQQLEEEIAQGANSNNQANVSNNNQQGRSPQSQSFFIKCSECRQKPATIRCFDCKRLPGSNRFCYTCDSRIHSSLQGTSGLAPAHRKEIIPYSEMYNRSRDDEESDLGRDQNARYFNGAIKTSPSLERLSSAVAGSAKNNGRASPSPSKGGGGGEVINSNEKLRTQLERSESERRKREIMQKISILNEKLSPLRDHALLSKVSQVSTSHRSGGGGGAAASNYYEPQSSTYEGQNDTLNFARSPKSASGQRNATSSKSTSVLNSSQKSHSYKELHPAVPIAKPVTAASVLIAASGGGGTGLSEFRERLRNQELTNTVQSLRAQLESQRRTQEVELKKLRDELRTAQDEALHALRRQTDDFQLERKDYESTINDLERALLRESQKNEQLEAQHNELENLFSQQRADMEGALDEVRRAYEDKLQETENLLSDQQQKIEELQKTIYEQQQQQQEQEQEQEQDQGQQQLQEEDQEEQEEEEAQLRQINQQNHRQRPQETLKVTATATPSQISQMEQYENIIKEKDNIIKSLQESSSLKDLEISKQEELISNFKQLFEQLNSEKESGERDREQVIEHLSHQKELLERERDQLNEQVEAFKQFIQQSYQIQQEEDEDNAQDEQQEIDQDASEQDTVESDDQQQQNYDNQ